MSLARRAALLRWADRHDAVIVEDDYDSEFRFSDRPLEPLQSLDRDGRVVYVGTFSKSLLPALRIGFVVVPPRSLTPALREAKRVTTWDGRPDHAGRARGVPGRRPPRRHVRRATRVYRERRALVLDGLARLDDVLRAGPIGRRAARVRAVP